MEIKCNSKLEELLFMSDKNKENYTQKLEILNLEFSFPFKNAKYKIKDRFYWVGYSVIALVLIIVVTLLSKADNKNLYFLLILIFSLPIVLSYMFYYKAKKDLKKTKKDYDLIYQQILEEYKNSIVFDAKVAFLTPGVVFFSEKYEEIKEKFEEKDFEQFMEYITENIFIYKNKIYTDKNEVEDSSEEPTVENKDNIYKDYYNNKKEEIIKEFKKENLESFLQYYLSNSLDSVNFSDLESKKNEIDEIVNYYKEWKYTISGYKMTDEEKKARLVIANAKSKKFKENDKSKVEDE